jgi:hypothetical protein
MEMKNKILLFTILLTLFVFQPARAQDTNELILRLSRDWGYSSGTGKIQGLFTLKATGPDNLDRVAFYIDDQVIGEATVSPFKYQLDTDNYDLGVHTLEALGFTSDGREIASNQYRLEFVSAEMGWQSGARVALPIVGTVFGIILLVYLVPALLGRGKRQTLAPGAPRNYGVLGGAVCPKCSRPFAVHIYGLNLLVGKYDCCPYCGKWSLVRQAPIETLRAAEAAELADAQGVVEFSGESEEEELRKQLDDSRYRDL